MSGTPTFDGTKAKRCRARVRPGKPKIRQSDAARALGVSRATLSYWENGRATPTDADIDAMSKLYKSDRSELLT